MVAAAAAVVAVAVLGGGGGAGWWRWYSGWWLLRVVVLREVVLRLLSDVSRVQSVDHETPCAWLVVLCMLCEWVGGTMPCGPSCC